MLLGNDLLEQKMADIRQAKRAQAMQQGVNPDTVDTDPTLAEIQETHIIHF